MNITYPEFEQNPFLDSNMQGKHFDGSPLTEDNLHAGQLCLFRGKQYTTGNRYKDLVELMEDGVFVRTVRMKSIYLINE